MSDEMLPIQRLDILRAACCVAGIDGDANEAQAAVLNRLAREVGVGKASLGAMIERAETDKTFHEEQFKVLEFEPKTTMATLLEVALADGELSASEADVLRILAGRLKIDSGMFEQLLDQVRP
jgi:tellurite resistance protein